MTDFSEFMRTASDQEKEAIYNIVLEKSTEEQIKTLEEHLNKIENEQDEQSSIKLLTPGADDVFSEQDKRKIFRTKSAMCDYLSMTKAVAGQFRIGNMNGTDVYELVFISEDN